MSLSAIARVLVVSLMLSGACARANAAAPIAIRIAAPAYLELDGRWYVFEPPFALAHTHQVTLIPKPELPGFFLHGFLSARNCTAADGQEPQGTAPQLAHGESLVGAFDGQFALARDPTANGLPLVKVGFCPGSVVMFLASPEGNLTCENEIAAPYAPGECGLLDALATAAAKVFDSSFEPRRFNPAEPRIP